MTTNGRQPNPEATARFEEACDLCDRAFEAQQDQEEDEMVESLFQQAIEGFDDALELGLSPDEAITAHAYRGYAHFELGKYEQAIVDLNEAIEKDQEFATAYWYRGLVRHYGQELPADAEVDYNRALDLFEKDPEYCDLDDAPAVYLDRAEAQRELGKWEDAAASATRAVSLESDNAEALYLLAVAEANSGRLSEASTHLQQAIHLEAELREEAEEEDDLAPLRADPTLWSQALASGRRRATGPES
jgi:tetratricopeptide (TPR) repeat protein